MLARLRASLPGVRSLLMDRETLLSHRPMWTIEEAPHIANLDRLTPSEAALYADLRFDRLSRSVRLEQERMLLERVGNEARAQELPDSRRASAWQRELREHTHRIGGF